MITAGIPPINPPNTEMIRFIESWEMGGGLN